MENDKLKDFVKQHQAEFEDIEPSADLFQNIQNRIAQDAKAPEKKAKVIAFKWWWAAAAACIVGAFVYLLPQKASIETNMPLAKVQAPNRNSIQKNIVPTQGNTMVKSTSSKLQTFAKSDKKATPLKQETLAPKEEDKSVDVKEAIWNDDAPTSQRLAAVLAMSEQTALNTDEKERIQHILEHDESSNVRLAALDLLVQKDQSISLGDELKKQKDPFLQMEILSLMSPEEAEKSKKILTQVSQNPMNIGAVRDQAYVAMLQTNF